MQQVILSNTSFRMAEWMKLDFGAEAVFSLQYRALYPLVSQ